MTSEPPSPRDGAPFIVRSPIMKGLLTVPSTTAEGGQVEEDVDEKTGLKRGQKAFLRGTPHPPLTTRTLKNRCNKQPPTNRSQRLSSHNGHTKRASVQCSTRSTNDGGSIGRRLVRERGMKGENVSNKSMPQQERGQPSCTSSIPTSSIRQPRRPSSAKPSKLLEARDVDATSAGRDV